jgi:hypothetical protein
MGAGKDTWLVMHRGVSDSLTVGDAPSVHLALVLDPRDGRALGVMPGRTRIAAGSPGEEAILL